MTPPIFSVIDGVQREVTSIPVIIDGVQRELDSMTATIAGVEREIFSSGHKWERYEVATRVSYLQSSIRTTLEFTEDDFTTGSIMSWGFTIGCEITGEVAEFCEMYVMNDEDYEYCKYKGILYALAGYYNETKIYVYEITEKENHFKGNYIDTVESTDPAAYPDNGEQDGYWYVKI